MNKKVNPGILELFSGAVYSVFTVWSLWTAAPFYKTLSVAAVVAFALLLTFSALPIAGGIAALRRKAWSLALAGALCSPVLFSGIPALRDIIDSREDWSHIKRKSMLGISLFAFFAILFISILAVFEIDVEVFRGGQF